MPGQSSKQMRKDKVWENIRECAAKYSKCMFVNVDNVTSKQICVMRKQIRACGGIMVMGKNTLMKKALKELIEEHKEAKKDTKNMQIIHDHLVLNVGLIFTDGDLADISAILDTQVREAPAKIGALAPKDVQVPAGPTGLDPKQTQFF